MDAVTASQVCKTFPGRRPVPALLDVDLAIREGELFGLLGPNGAGKTTLITVLIGLTTPDRGSVSICGLDVATRLHQVQGLINLVRGFSGVLEKFTTWDFPICLNSLYYQRFGIGLYWVPGHSYTTCIQLSLGQQSASQAPRAQETSDHLYTLQGPSTPSSPHGAPA